MKNKLIAIICMFLILSTPLEAYAQTYTQAPPTTAPSPQQHLQEENLGEAITIEVSEYQPIVIPAPMIEKNNIPVYVFLKGVTPGSILFDQGSPTIEPFIGIPKVKSAYVFVNEISRDFVVGTPVYIPPIKTYQSIDNLGYLIVTLRKIEKEKDVPDKITLNMTMRLYFDIDRGFGDVSKQDLVLTEAIDENVWKQGEKQDFWNKKGYLKVSDISSSKATIFVYDTYLNQISSFTLNKDERSPIIKLLGSSPFFNDNLRVKLNEISEPQTKVELKIIVGGNVYNKILTKGMPIYPGSNWVVDEVVEGTKLEKGNKIRESVILKDSVGNKEIISKTYDPLKIDIDKERIKNVLEDNPALAENAWNTIVGFVSKMTPSKVKEVGGKVVTVVGNLNQYPLNKRTYLNIINYIKSIPDLRPIYELLLQGVGIYKTDDEISVLESNICKNYIIKDDKEIEDLQSKDNKDALKSYE